MCWNAEVSLNTFLFSGFVLLLIIYNNAYTQYKIKDLNSKWTYVFFLSFILMQLIEFFIWRNVNNPYYNSIFTMLATILLFFQPIASTMILTNNKIRNSLLVLYLIIAVPFMIYRFLTKKIYSEVTPLNHLHWNMVFYDNIHEHVSFFIWLFFFLFPLFYQGYFYGFLFGLLTFIIITYKYYKDKSVGSMWCWIVNTVMLYYAAYLLLYLPFYK
jgi:hypothetical protein